MRARLRGVTIRRERNDFGRIGTLALLTLEFTVEPELHGVRIDTFLASHLRNYTSWRLARLVRAGGVTIHAEPVPDDRRVMRWERVQVRLLEPPDKLLPPEPRDLPIVYADPWLIVVDKPAGLIAHPTGEFQTGTLANVMQYYLDRQTVVRGLLRPGVVHRLDRQTSGLMVVAVQHLAHARLSTAFEQGRVQKTYLALVEGRIENDSGVIDLPIGRARSGRGVLMSARADAVDRRAATTRYRVVTRYANHTLVEARPQTGRNHQIRVHFAHIGHPLVGDEFYLAHGAVRSPRSIVRAQRSGLLEDEAVARPEEPDRNSDENDPPHGWRHALHASRLEFAHPITGCWLQMAAPLPTDIQQMVAAASGGQR